jgi:arabinogalactan oligomer/maltooligosaccharide transport system permease protein
MSDTATLEEREVKTSRSPGAAKYLIVKIILVGLVDALLIIALAQAIQAEWWLAVGFFAFALIAVNAVYFSGRALPLKYLIPGLLFLMVFQLYTMFFTAYASFTNYGTGHLDTKQSAITAIEQASVTPVPDSPEFPVVPVVKDDVVSMLITDPTTGEVSLGTNEEVTPVPPAEVQRSGEQVTGVAGYTSLNLGSLSSNPDYKAQWDALRPPIDETQGIYLRPISITKATQAKAGFVYDEAQDAMVNTSNGEVSPADGSVGNFIQPSGEALFPGWRVSIGVSNYTTLFTDETIRARFLPITAWTFFFAIATTFLNFTLGLFLAIVLSEKRMRGQGIYRLLLIVPYGLPFILMAGLWKGMLNTDFGLINQILGQSIPWLTDTWLARFSILMVNMWLGFPYFLLVCSGALTAIPNDLKEAAYVDGASGRHAFRTVVLPLLLVATAPLLVTTFAFNFNNYTLIEVVTGGGPFPGTVNEGGSTDLLINYTYRMAFNDSNQQLGLASAIAMIIFVIVGTVSAYGFRLTRKLEEIGA